MIEPEVIKQIISNPRLIHELQMSLSARLILTSGLEVITANVASEILGMDRKYTNRPINELVDKGFLVRDGGDRKNGYTYKLV